MGALYRRCAERGELLTLGGHAVDVGALLAAALERMISPPPSPRSTCPRPRRARIRCLVTPFGAAPGRLKLARFIRRAAGVAPDANRAIIAGRTSRRVGCHRRPRHSEGGRGEALTDELSGPSAASGYPARLAIDYPEDGLNRLTTAFRLFMMIPIGVVAALLTGYAGDREPAEAGEGARIVIATGGFLFLPALLMILFRRKYPRWWFDWNLELSRFSARIGAYFLLLRDEYPSTDEHQTVHLDLDYPDAAHDLNRWLPLVKWLLAIPHYVVLLALGVIILILVIVAWFAILVTGRYPRGIFDFVVGVSRWQWRVQAYVFLLATDRYPPFSLDP